MGHELVFWSGELVSWGMNWQSAGRLPACFGILGLPLERQGLVTLTTIPWRYRLSQSFRLSQNCASWPCPAWLVRSAKPGGNRACPDSMPTITGMTQMTSATCASIIDPR